MKRTPISVAAILTCILHFPADAQTAPVQREMHRSAAGLSALREPNIMATLRAIVVNYGLHTTPEAAPTQLARDASILARLKVWATDAATQLDESARKDMVDAIARLQARNNELTAQKAAASNQPSLMDQRKALLPDVGSLR